MLILASHAWPPQASRSSLHSLQPVHAQALRQGTPGAKQTLPKSVRQAVLQRVSHDILAPSDLLHPGIPTHVPHCPFQCPRIPDGTPALPSLPWGNPATSAMSGQGICPSISPAGLLLWRGQCKPRATIGSVSSQQYTVLPLSQELHTPICAPATSSPKTQSGTQEVVGFLFVCLFCFFSPQRAKGTVMFFLRENQSKFICFMLLLYQSSWTA